MALDQSPGTPPSTKAETISFDDYLQLTALMFGWGDSYDAKIDYRGVMDERWHWEAMPAEAYIKMISDTGFLGDPLIKTQHLLGATEWERISDTEVIGHHQLRAAHNRFTDLTFQKVDRRGHSHATNEHFYRKIEGVWKFAGLRPKVRWNEYDFEQVFKGISFEGMAKANGSDGNVEVAPAKAST